MSGSSPLMTPVQIGSLHLPTRIVMSAMTRNRARADGTPTPLMATYYAQRAGAAFVTTEATQVTPDGIGYLNTPGLYTDAHEAGWRQVTDAVHAAGGRILVQLFHVGRISHPDFQPGGARPVAPSAVTPKGYAYTASGRQAFVEPRTLERHEIRRVVRAFGDATRRARAAGFDGVELHGANGYLIDQFLRDGVNRRTDEYGGSIDNRLRVLHEVLSAMSDAWEPGRVGLKVSPFSTYNDMSDTSPRALYVRLAEALRSSSLAYLHVVEPVAGGDHDGGERLTPRLRERFGGPVIANDGYDGARAEAALLNGEADLVAFAASFLANPDLPERLRLQLPLNPPDPSTFYGGTEKGYTDYPRWEERTVRA